MGGQDSSKTSAQNKSRITEIANFARRILLVTTGLSPQVVTEALYALVHSDPPFIPTEIRLITTKSGKQVVEDTLLGENGWFHQLCKDYDLPNIEFSSNSIFVLHGLDGKPLDDIRSPEDNRVAADQVSDYIRNLASDQNTVIHASIAGGRKTIGVLVSMSLSLYARKQDKLSHVLVSPAFESHPDFFYPPLRECFIQPKDAKVPMLDAQLAEVTLAKIPFVKLREELPLDVLEKFNQFEEVVDIAQTSIGSPQLVIDLKGKKIEANDKVIKVPPSLLAFLAWFAAAKTSETKWISCPSEGVPDLEYAESYLNYYQKSVGRLGDFVRSAKRLEAGMSRSFFSQKKSSWKSHIVSEVGAELAQPYLISRTKKGRQWRFTLNLPSTNIHFKEIK